MDALTVLHSLLMGVEVKPATDLPLPLLLSESEPLSEPDFGRSAVVSDSSPSPSSCLVLV